MDINEMRKRYREKKKAEQLSSTSSDKHLDTITTSSAYDDKQKDNPESISATVASSISTICSSLLDNVKSNLDKVVEYSYNSSSNRNTSASKEVIKNKVAKYVDAIWRNGAGAECDPIVPQNIKDFIHGLYMSIWTGGFKIEDLDFSKWNWSNGYKALSSEKIFVLTVLTRDFNSHAWSYLIKDRKYEPAIALKQKKAYKIKFFREQVATEREIKYLTADKFIRPVRVDFTHESVNYY